MSATVAQVYDNLSDQQRSQAFILASNYGEASPLIFLGRAYEKQSIIKAKYNKTTFDLLTKAAQPRRLQLDLELAEEEAEEEMKNGKGKKT